ncbi:MAG TPA: hypothetical protein ENJ19_10350 [Gammaproteobacteria bacterium]|nr:hypothetical protein [Gammaproteobacteria bacterium]
MIVTALIVFAELGAIGLVVFLIWLFRALGRKKRERVAVNALVENINSQQSERVDQLATLIKDAGQGDDADAMDKANDLISRQNEFYQQTIDMYFSRNDQLLGKFDQRLESVLEQYRAVVEGVLAGGVSSELKDTVERLTKDIQTLNNEVSSLRAENADLHMKLNAAEQELDQLGHEYVSAFKKQKEQAAKVAAAGGAAPAPLAASPAPVAAAAVEEPEPDPFAEAAAALSAGPGVSDGAAAAPEKEHTTVDPYADVLEPGAPPAAGADVDARIGASQAEEDAAPSLVDELKAGAEAPLRQAPD